MSRLDVVLPQYDVREHHCRWVPADPALAVDAALGVPVAPDALVRTLARLRGLPGGGSVLGTIRALGFVELVREPSCVVLGAAGRPWRRGAGLVPFERAGPGQVRVVVEVAAAPAPGGGSLLATETRVAAVDAAARRAFRAYWLAVGPFSALIRRRWLAAAERALR